MNVKNCLKDAARYLLLVAIVSAPEYLLSTVLVFIMGPTKINKLLFLFQPIVLISGCVLFFVFKKNRKEFLRSFVFKKIPASAVFIAIAIGIVLSAIGHLVMGNTYSMDMATAVNSLSLVFIAPFIEEMYFRGAMFLERKSNTVFSMVFSSLLFSISHLNFRIDFIIMTFIFGMVFCLMAKKINSIIPGVIAHFIYNLSVVLLPFLLG